jgi:hypothetical protein
LILDKLDVLRHVIFLVRVSIDDLLRVLLEVTHFKILILQSVTRLKDVAFQIVNIVLTTHVVVIVILHMVNVAPLHVVV